MIARLSNVETQDVASQMYLMYIFEEDITRLRHGSIKCEHSIRLFLVTINVVIIIILAFKTMLCV